MGIDLAGEGKHNANGHGERACSNESACENQKNLIKTAREGNRRKLGQKGKTFVRRGRIPNLNAGRNTNLKPYSVGNRKKAQCRPPKRSHQEGKIQEQRGKPNYGESCVLNNLGV